MKKNSDERAVAVSQKKNPPIVPPEMDKKPQLDLELGIPRTLRSEFNFLKYPFFDLAGDSRRAKIEITESVATGEGTFNILWRVTRNIESKFPGDFEKRVHRTIEQIINATPKPINNPVRIGSVHYIARLMGINADSGKNYRDIQQALKNIVKTSIEARGTFQLKTKKSKEFIDDTFHLYDRVIFKGEVLPTGDVADSIFIMLGSWYLQNINSNYVVPLDWKFYNELTGSITTRMYEFLSIYFFSSLERNRQYYDVRYSVVCNYFPLVKQYPAWKARKQLKHAHESLVQAGYLSNVDWLDVSDATDDWVLRYWIGSKAKDEYERNKGEIRQFGEQTRPIPLPDRRRRGNTGAGDDSNTAPNAPDLFITREMVDVWGFTPVAATSLIKRYSEARVKEVLAWAAWTKQYKPKLIEENPAGWIRSALKENWKKPAGFESEQERLQRDQERALQQKKLKDSIAEQEKEKEWQEWYNTLPEQRIRGDHWLWVRRYTRDHDGNEPSQAEQAQKQVELVKALPTNEEKQKQIFGYIKYPDQLDG